ADEGGQAHVPAGFLQGFAQGRGRKALVGLQVSGRLVDDQAAAVAGTAVADMFLDAQQAPVADHHGGHGHVRLPETSFAIAHGRHSIIGAWPANRATSATMASWWRPASRKWRVRRCIPYCC